MKLLNEIQQKLKVPKGQYNAFSKFYYRNAEDILEAVKPLLGIGTLTITDEVVQVGERYYVKATATLAVGTPVITSGPNGIGEIDGTSRVSACGWAREALEKKGMDEAQITGSASSYARKYALNGLFCIDDTKDADHDDGNGPVAPKTAPQAKPVPKPVYVPPTPKTDARALDSEREAAARLNGAKDRIKGLLIKLGYTELKKPEDYASAVFMETDVDLAKATDLASLEAIGEKLATNLEKK